MKRMKRRRLKRLIPSESGISRGGSAVKSQAANISSRFLPGLAAGPGLLLLDEPEAGLDFRNQRRILSTLKSLRGKGVSSVFITHYPDHALELADDALLLGKGKAPVFGRASDVLTEESLSEAFGIQVRIRDVQIPEGIRKTVIAAE